MASDAAFWLTASTYSPQHAPTGFLPVRPDSSDRTTFKAQAAVGEADKIPPDRWLGWDKVQHATFSFLFTIGSQYTFVNKVGLGERDALPISMTISGALGLAKELNDRYRGPTRYFSKRDLVADAAGILLGAGLILL